MYARTQTQAGGNRLNRFFAVFAIFAMTFFFATTTFAQNKIDGEPEDCGCPKTQVSEQYNLDKPGLLKAMLTGKYQNSKAVSKIDRVGKRSKNVEGQKLVDNKVAIDPVWCLYYPMTSWGPVDRCFYEDVYCDTFVWFNVTYCYPYPQGI